MLCKWWIISYIYIGFVLKIWAEERMHKQAGIWGGGVAPLQGSISGPWFEIKVGRLSDWNTQVPLIYVYVVLQLLFSIFLYNYVSFPFLILKFSLIIFCSYGFRSQHFNSVLLKKLKFLICTISLQPNQQTCPHSLF